MLVIVLDLDVADARPPFQDGVCFVSFVYCVALKPPVLESGASKERSALPSSRSLPPYGAPPASGCYLKLIYLVRDGLPTLV